MKKLGVMAGSLSLLSVLVLTAAAQDQLPNPQQQKPLPDRKTAYDQASYGFGINIGGELKGDNIELNFDLFLEGVKDAFSGAKSRYTDEQLQAAFAVVQQEVAARRIQMLRELSEKNTKDGQAFLASNKGKPGVVTTASGLQYFVIEKGAGPSPTAKDVVSTHYHGMLLDGTVFDSTVQVPNTPPATFAVGDVIPGWSEALQLMKVGDKWRLFVPSNLAYGEEGAAPSIGPNATLVFDVKLLAVNPPQQQQPGAAAGAGAAAGGE